MTPWPGAYEAPLFLRFSRQEYWSGLPFSPPRDLPNSPASPALAGIFSITGPPGKPIVNKVYVCVHATSLLCNPVVYNPPDSSVHGTLQGRILEWVAMPSSRGPQYCYLNLRLDKDFTNCPNNVLYCERKHRLLLHSFITSLI